MLAARQERTDDLFAVLGIPRRLAVDVGDLERRYLDAARVVHPDRHAGADPRTRELSVTTAAAVNRAWRTLRDPVARGRYWLEFHGESLGRDNATVPPGLAELVFETQETLEEFRAGTRDREAIARVHAELDARVRSLTANLTAQYATWDARGADAPSVLAELKRRLSELAYLDTLRADVDEALGV